MRAIVIQMQSLLPGRFTTTETFQGLHSVIEFSSKLSLRKVHENSTTVEATLSPAIPISETPNVIPVTRRGHSGVSQIGVALVGFVP
jgi:hypothetical protein